MSPDRSPRENAMTAKSESDLPSRSEVARLAPTATMSSISIEVPTLPEARIPGPPDSVQPTPATLRALIGRFNFPWVESVLLAETVAFVALSVVRKKPTRDSFASWLRASRTFVPHLRPIEWLAVGGIAFIAVLVVYQASFYPI